MMSDFFAERQGSPAGHRRWCRGCRSITTWVCSWGFAPDPGGSAGGAHQPEWGSCSGRPAGCKCWRAMGTYSAAPNFAFELAARKTSDDDMAGLDLGGVHIISAVASGYSPRLSSDSPSGSRASIFATRQCGRHTGSRKQRCTWRPADRVNHPKSSTSSPRNCLPATRSGAKAEAAQPLVSYGVPQSPIVRIVDPDTCTECPEGTAGEIWVHGDNVGAGLLAETGRERAHVRRKAC